MSLIAHGTGGKRLRLLPFIALAVMTTVLGCMHSRQKEDSPDLSQKQDEKREIDMAQEWKIALNQLSPALLNDPIFTETPPPNFKTMTFGNGGTTIEVSIVGHKEGKTAVTIRSIHPYRYLEGLQLVTLAGLFPLPFQCHRYSSHYGDDSGMLPPLFGPTFDLSYTYCARFSVLRDVKGSLWPLGMGKSMSAYTSYEGKRSHSELAAEGKMVNQIAWGPPEDFTIMDDREPCHLGVSAWDALVHPAGPISVTVLKQAADAGILTDFNVRAPVKGPFWVMSDGRCQYLYSEELRWVIGARPRNGEDKDNKLLPLIGYTTNDGKAVGVQFDEAGKASLQAHKRNKAQDLAKFKREVPAYRASLAAQKRAEEELERQYSAEFSQELYKQLGVAFGTLATGLQQAQAIRQGAPGSAIGLPIPDVSLVEGSGFRTGHRHVDEAADHIRQAIAAARREDPSGFVSHCEEAERHLMEANNTTPYEFMKTKPESTQQSKHWHLSVGEAQRQITAALSYGRGLLSMPEHDANRRDYYRAGIMAVEKANESLRQSQ